MTVKIDELMAKRVVTAQPHHSVAHVRGLMERNRVHAIPIVGPDREAVGMVSSADLMAGVKDATPVGQVMTERVMTLPAYNDASVAARVMRKHKIHHVVVTHEKQVVGVISSFDLLKLVEGKRFEAKPAPTQSKRRQRKEA
jgi:CBS domain-containing protein